MRTIALTLAALSVLAAPAAFASTDDTSPRTATVTYEPDSLLTEDGANQLRRRVQRAASTICGDRFARDPSVSRNNSACYAQTNANAQDLVSLAIARARGGQATNSRAVIRVFAME